MFRHCTTIDYSTSPIIENKQIVQTGSKNYPIKPVQDFFAIKEKVWKLPLMYSELERQGAKLAQEYIKKDPRLSKIINI